MLTLVTPPAADVVTLSEAKQFLRIDDGDADALIASLITTATVAAETYTKRAFITQTYRKTFDIPTSRFYENLPDGVFDLPISFIYGDIGREFNLDRMPIQSITSFTSYDTNNNSTVYAASNYYLDAAGARLVLNSSAVLPANMRKRAAIEIVYVCGYGDTSSAVPAPIKSAVLMHVASLYEQRGQCDDAMDLPAGAKMMLNQYRVMGYRRD